MNITPTTNVFDTAVIGGGASGLMAAGCCGENGIRTVLIEKNAQPGKKLSITGKGRCNVTNDCSPAEFLENVPTNPRFLYAAINSFSPHDTMDFFESIGVTLKTERGRRVFPVSDKAADITHSLVSYCRRGGVQTAKGVVTAIEKRDGLFYVVVNGEKTIIARNAVICTGGMTYQSTGSTGDGYEFAKSFGHTVTPLTPSLVPLVSPDALCEECMGLTLNNVRVSFEKNGKALYAETGDML
ncbi:MAG TPA: aminoacetone oxidase family FAD-binding enzyme, partial [Bacillota bacterium]|nr:aminoacetone oxidase family FAD-binding enzyme [Bacillota bacterium]